MASRNSSLCGQDTVKKKQNKTLTETGQTKTTCVFISLMLACSQRWWTHPTEKSGEWNAADVDSFTEA